VASSNAILSRLCQRPRVAAAPRYFRAFLQQQDVAALSHASLVCSCKRQLSAEALSTYLALSLQGSAPAPVCNTCLSSSCPRRRSATAQHTWRSRPQLRSTETRSSLPHLRPHAATNPFT
jgi:hypothetical protein